ncbi:MAG TPA: hypothetical protein VF881_10415 [Polyangiaceae bacterium]
MPTIVPNVNSSDYDWHPVISSDELTLYLASYRTEGDAMGQEDIWVSTRSSTEDFGPARNVRELNSSANDGLGWLSADRCVLYFLSDRDGYFRLYHATHGK